MALLENLDQLDRDGKMGDWCFLNEDTYIAIRYGEESFRGTAVLRIKPSSGLLHWDWDGNREAPTLSPSILILGEEMGEVQQAALHDRFGGKAAGTLREELIQVVAVGIQWLECIERRNKK